jgi:choline dehydrogenase-like flavoprotein
LRRAGNIKLVLHATATEILTSANAAVVQEIRIASTSDRRGRVRARSYVVACGGIETPRLMLLSNRVESAGLANENDLVGRFFMEHPHPDAGGVFIDGDLARFRPYVERNADGAQIVLGLGPSAAAQRRLQILNSSVEVHDSLHVPPSEGWDSLTKLARAADEWRWPDSAGTHIYRVLRDLDDVILEGYRRSRDRPIQGYSFIARTETAPNPANRVTLSADLDALDQPRARLDWRLGAQERRSVQQTMMLLAAEFGRLGVGRVRFNELLLEDDARWSENLSWFGHHMGTTRMSEDPASGVVNPDCRVHGLANLYVAGSSVFPTSGFANPTLTLLALALRLADHLKGDAPL